MTCGISVTLRNGYICKLDEQDLPLLDQYVWYGSMIGGGQSSSKKHPYVIAPVKAGGKQKWVRLHRLIMDCPSGLVVDHINGDTLDNRRSNLRIVTHQQNCFNQRKDKWKGIAFCPPRRTQPRPRWRAFIQFREGGQKRFRGLGYHNTAVEAAAAYNRAAMERFGEFACLNDLLSLPPPQPSF